MPITNFPGGASSFGLPAMPGLSVQSWGGGAVYWVSNVSGAQLGDGSAPDRPLSSVFGSTGALSKVNGKNGVTIFVAPGHVESISASTSMSTLAGAAAININIIGLGSGLSTPIFNWTAAASALLVNLPGTWIRNCRFNLSATAATVVTAAITFSAADCGFDTIDILPNTSATQLTTTGMTVATGATNLTFLNVKCVSETFATNPTDILTTTAAVDKLTMRGCVFLTAVNSTTNGVVNLANAPTNVYVEDCAFNNKKAASTVAFIASASTTGTIAYSSFVVQASGAPSTALNTPGNLGLNQCFGGQIGKNLVKQGTDAA